MVSALRKYTIVIFLSLAGWMAYTVITLPLRLRAAAVDAVMAQCRFGGTLQVTDLDILPFGWYALIESGTETFAVRGAYSNYFGIPVPPPVGQIKIGEVMSCGD